MRLYQQFLEGLLADPRGVSAPTPSSKVLSAAIAAKVNPSVPGPIIELGAGTGAVTTALLERGIMAERLIVFESSAAFCRILRSRFPGIRVICGDALKFERYLAAGERVAAVVSGLPLLNLEPAERHALIDKALDMQGPQGRLVQLSYGWKPAIKRARDFAVSKQLVWRNFPPAHIWIYSKASQSAPARPLKKLGPQLAA